MIVNRKGVAALAAAILLAGCSSDPSRPGGSLRMAEDRFVGSETCGACHQDAYKSWKGTMHAKMVLPAKEGLLKDSVDYWAKDSKGNAGPTKANITGAPATLDDVVYVIGTKWKQRFLVKNPQTGNHQFLDKQWNRASRLWEPYGQKNDWETQCATCHVTGYRVLEVGPKNAVMKATFAERNVGCESCHGPGLKHANSRNKADILNPRKVSKAEADRVCGYCHIRTENEFWHTAQGNAAEQVPHPVAGETYKPGTDNWTAWYTDKLLLPGIHKDDPVNKNYPNTDLNNAFYQDEAAQKSGYHEALKHHQQYQEHLQSKHAKANLLGCIDCHGAHSGGDAKQIAANAACTSCHGASMDAKKMMPGLAQTAGGLMMRSHSFNPNPRAPRGTTADQLPPPVFAYPQK